MNDKISTELLKVMNEISDNETIISKIDSSIFIRTSQNIINEKVAYLYNLLKIEARTCNQRQEDYFDDIDLIITHFRQKLNMVYDEFYCQYVNIQNELQEARNNKRIAMINFQKIINIHQKTPLRDINERKGDILKKYKIYEDIIEKCRLKFKESKEKFEEMINNEFLITSKSLQIITEQNFIQRILGKISSIFNGGKKFLGIIKDYNKIIDNIDSRDLVQKMRDETIEFVADIIEMRGFNENELEENVRIGGKNGYN